MFKTYLQLGFEHILDFNGYDHILFVVVLCALYTIMQWKEVLLMITAFTVGHSITLALSALNIVVFDAGVIEFLIPLTIFLTAMYNLYIVSKDHTIGKINYLLTLFFGLIHGLGFSNYFKALLGREESIIQPLFAFNIGVELGQIIIVLIVMFCSFVFVNKLRLSKRYWTVSLSIIAALVSLNLLLEAKFW